MAKNAFLDTTEEDEIEEFGEYDTHLKGIVSPETVTEIEANSFENVYSLKYFSAPGLKIVGDFSLDAPIVYLNAPNIEYIGKSGLVTNLSEINLPKLTFADDNAFCNNIYLTDVNVPSLTEGGAALFSNCKRLTNADLEQLKILRDCSFSKCCWLKNIMMPKLEEIADEMFSNCYKLEEVNIPNAKIIGEKAFYFTSSLDKVDFNFVTKINTMAFSNSSVEWINTPILDYLGSYCFANYSEFGKTYNINNILKSIYAPELNEIDDYAFAYTGGLTELDLPNLKSVGNNAFCESSVNYLYAPNLKTAGSLPTADNSVVVTKSVFEECAEANPNPTLTIQGEKGSYAENYTNKYNLEFVDVDAKGGSIRVTDAGLRFGFSFYDTKNKNVEEFGFIYSDSSTDNKLLTAYNADGKTIYNMSAPNRIRHDDGVTTYNLVFTDIPESAYDFNISARAYVKINGKFFYSDILTRSFSQVAWAVLADNDIDSNTKETIRNMLKSA